MKRKPPKNRRRTRESLEHAERVRDGMDELDDEDLDDGRMKWKSANRTYSDRLSEGFSMMGDE